MDIGKMIPEDTVYIKSGKGHPAFTQTIWLQKCLLRTCGITPEEYHKFLTKKLIKLGMLIIVMFGSLGFIILFAVMNSRLSVPNKTTSVLTVHAHERKKAAEVLLQALQHKEEWKKSKPTQGAHPWEKEDINLKAKAWKIDTHGKLDTPCSVATDASLIENKCFTVVMFVDGTESPDMCLRTLRFYIKMKRIHKIIVLWPKWKPPINMERALGSTVPIIVKLMRKVMVTLKYTPFREIKTKAILSLSEGVIVNEADINHGFQVWTGHPNHLVGFEARGHKKMASGAYKYSFCCEDKYSMVTGQAMFYNKNYNRIFKGSPNNFKALIDSRNSCDDMALNFLVSDICKCTAALYVKPKLKVRQLIGSKAHGKIKSFLLNRKPSRDVCMMQLIPFFDSFPLRYSSAIY